jgi:hypothetical protein
LSRVIVFGGYGVFGSQVARLLAEWGIPLTIAGRDLRQANAFARELGGHCTGRLADITTLASCRAALDGHTVAVNCAGPFQSLGSQLLEACLEAGCHYTDIGDDRGYNAMVRSFGARFAKHGLSAVFGCSSLPGISGALALVQRDRSPRRIERVRVSLLIGNRNPKGYAAVRSLLGGLGKSIPTPQGASLGFRDREVVQFPAPFGVRGVFNFDAPEYDLFPSLLETRQVSVKVGFEMQAATYTFALLARLGYAYGNRAASLLDVAGRLLDRLGCSGGAVMTELFRDDGSIQRAALVAGRDGQRMAALPCALAARDLYEGRVPKPGAATAYEFLGARQLLEKLVAAGYQLITRASIEPGFPCPEDRKSWQAIPKSAMM